MIDEARCDVLVIGGGTAGAVLAARLSEDPRRQVILLEAGPDVAPDALPADVADLFPLSTFNPAWSWPGLTAHWRGAQTSAAVSFQQGRAIGGGGTVMGMWAVRGVPDDYDTWATMGARGWSWSEVLPWFRRIETDHDFGGPLHGADGPLPIRRQARADWSPLAQAMQTVALEQGHAQIDDMNADFRDGHCVLPISRHASVRASAGLCWLDARARARSNLRILPRTEVQRIDIQGRRATGATARRADRTMLRIRAHLTVLSAGAVFSPAVLMRSGIGPGDHLRACGIAVALHRSGVGGNLQNHPLLPALAWLAPGGRDARRGRPPAATYLRWTSPGASRGDMGLYIRSYLLWHALGRRLAMVGPVLMQPKARGTVRLDPKAPADLPRIAFNFLDHPDDLHRMMAGLRKTGALFATPAMRAVCGAPFVMTGGAGLARYNALSRANAVRAAALALLVDTAPRLGQAVFARLADCEPLAEALVSDDRLADLVVRAIGGTNHVAGTCRMGAADDPGAVTDPAGRVIGLEALVVADASVMPTVPSGNTHVPVAMLAERIAAMLCEGPT